MKRLKAFALFLLAILLITSSACSKKNSLNAFDYPKEITPKYCFENYRAFDHNIIYTECYEFVTTRNRKERILGFASIEYSAIKGVEDLSFMVYYKSVYWMGEGRWIGVVRHRDCNIEPIIDYTPSKIELCAYKGLNPVMIDVEKNPEMYYDYASHSFSEPILTVNSPEAIAEIMDVAQKPRTMTTEENYKEQAAGPSMSDLSLVLWENEPVYIKISFKECSGMVWSGRLFTDNKGVAYMERLVYVHGEGADKKDAMLHVGDAVPTPQGKGFYYPLGENMDAIISELITDGNK